MKDKTTAALLAFLLGGIGGHRFYLGQAGAGLLYLLFSWTLVPLFISFFECILLLLMDDKSFNLKYNVLYLGSGNQVKQTQNIVVNVPPTSQNREKADIVSQLERLHQLRVNGAISEHEYQNQKSKLLSS